MIRGKLGRNCIFMHSLLMVLIVLLTFIWCISVYKNSTLEYIWELIEPQIDSIKDNIGIGTMEYYIKNNTSDDKLLQVQDVCIDFVERTDKVSRIQVVLNDINGYYMFYDTNLEYKMGDHILLSESHYNNKVYKLTDNTVDLSYPIKVNNTLYGYVTITRDISLANSHTRDFSTLLIIGLIGIGFILNIVYLVVLGKNIIMPINELSNALDGYSRNNHNDIDIQDFHKRKSNYVSQLDIKTNNEIEVICNNLKLLEYDVNNYLDKLSNLKLNADEDKINIQLLEVIMKIQSMVIKQMYIDFKSFLPILAYYFNAERVLFIDYFKDECAIMMYGDKKYLKYTTKATGLNSLIDKDDYHSIEVSKLPETLTKIILKDYNKDKVGITMFGDSFGDRSWKVMIVKSSLEDTKINVDIIVRAIKSCVKSFF